LYVSILTDRLQGGLSLILVALLVVYVISLAPSMDQLPPLTEEQLGFTSAGYSSILTQPLACFSWLFLSESIWQRVWAAEDNKVLRRAGFVGGAAIAVVIFIFGFVGWLALWSGRADASTNPNLYFFAFFSREGAARLQGMPGFLAMLCAAMMSQGAVDSFQNGITATLSSTLLNKLPLWVTRVTLLVVNLPLAILGASPDISNVLQLFLLINEITLCCTIPVLAALCQAETLKHLITEDAVVLGCLGGFFGVTAYGWLRVGSLLGGIHMAWIGNEYAYDYFLVIVACSVSGLCLGIVRGCATRHFNSRRHNKTNKVPELSLSA